VEFPNTLRESKLSLSLDYVDLVAGIEEASIGVVYNIIGYCP
jgi:hypothetical protein